MMYSYSILYLFFIHSRPSSPSCPSAGGSPFEPGPAQRFLLLKRFLFFSAPVACQEVMPEFLLVFQRGYQTPCSERFGKVLAEAPGTLRCFTLYVVPQQSEKENVCNHFFNHTLYCFCFFSPQHRHAVHVNAVHVYKWILVRCSHTLPVSAQLAMPPDGGSCVVRPLPSQTSLVVWAPMLLLFRLHDERFSRCERLKWLADSVSRVVGCRVYVFHLCLIVAPPSYV